MGWLSGISSSLEGGFYNSGRKTELGFAQLSWQGYQDYRMECANRDARDAMLDAAIKQAQETPEQIRKKEERKAEDRAFWAERARKTEEESREIRATIDPYLIDLMEKIKRRTPVSELAYLRNIKLLKERYLNGALATNLTLYDHLALAVKINYLEMAEFILAKLKSDCAKKDAVFNSYNDVSFSSKKEQFLLYSALTGNAPVFYFLLSHGVKTDCKENLKFLLGNTIIDSAFLRYGEGASWNAIDCLIYGRGKRLGPEEGYRYIENILRKQGIKACAVATPGCCSVQ
jgi:hypothetical protein